MSGDDEVGDGVEVPCAVSDYEDGYEAVPITSTESSSKETLHTKGSFTTKASHMTRKTTNCSAIRKEKPFMDEDGSGGDEDGSGGEDSAPEERNVNVPKSPKAVTPLVCSHSPKTGKWMSDPYRGAALRRAIEAANHSDDGRPSYEGVVNELRDQGVRVFIVGHDSPDLMKDVLSVVDVVSRNDRQQTYREKQRCLLYRDKADKVFNVEIMGETSGLAGAWQNLLLSFSCFEALVAMTVLTRTFPCIDINGLSGVRPGYLSLILGLVLTEEISQVMLNVGMLVQGRPSVSAYTLKARILTDWPRKLIILSLAIASAAPQDSLMQRWTTFAGIALAELVLLANIGSRAWYHMELSPLKYGGFFAPVVAFIMSVFAGLTVPFLGSRQVLAGGKAAMEGVIRNAIFVAILFVVSDIDDVQQFIMVGSDTCSHDGVNIGVGIWFTVTLITSMWFVAQTKRHKVRPEETEPLLEENHASPVGFKVPNLPDVSIDPALNKVGVPCCALGLEFALGVFLALIMGGGIVFTAFTTKDDELLNGGDNTT